MALPVIARPVSTVELLSNPIEVTVQAFTMKEQKPLLMIKDSDDTKGILQNVLKLVQNCVVSPKTLDVGNLPVFDLVKLFIEIIGISKGTVQNIYYKCNKCSHRIEKSVDLSLTEYGDVQKAPLIKVNDTIVIKLRYPSLKNIIDIISSDDEDTDNKLLCSCIYQVYNGQDDITNYNDVSFDELYNWYLELPQKTIDEMQDFFVKIPQPKLKVELACPKCGQTDTIEYTNFFNFFG